MKLHDTALKGVVHKVPNIHAPDKRDFFFPDAPHLIKTTRNCWSSKCRMLWVRNTVIIISTHCHKADRVLDQCMHRHRPVRLNQTTQ